ncbi:MAG: hypothetical protein ACHQET_05835 [Chitinophagales bacterium]
MKTLNSSCLFVLICCHIAASGQKAVPLQITSFLTRLQLPESSATCYAACDKTHDASNGAYTVTGSGPTYKNLSDEFQKIMQGDMAAMQNQSTQQTPMAPSPDQIAQMQQQAAQMQNMSPQQIMDMQKKNSNQQSNQNNVALLRKIGEAQSRLGTIQNLNQEFIAKLKALSTYGLDTVKLAPPCPDVRQGGGDIAVPTCGCLIARATAYETKRVKIYDNYVQGVRDILQQYIPKFNNEIAVIDKVEADARYGEGITDPTIKQQLYMLQRQGMSVVPGIIGVASGTTEDAGKYYSYLVNAQSGASVGCGGKK